MLPTPRVRSCPAWISASIWELKVMGMPVNLPCLLLGNKFLLTFTRNLSSALRASLFSWEPSSHSVSAFASSMQSICQELPEAFAAAMI